MCATQTKPFDEAAAAKLREAFDLDQKYRKPKVPKDKDFAKLVTATRTKLSGLVNKLINGILTDREFIDGMAEVLESGHEEAAILGRRLAGDFAEPELDDLIFAQGVMSEEAGFLSGFLNDLQVGRYRDSDGKHLTAQIKARARLYSGKLRGTANQTFVLASDEGEKFAWHQLTVEPCEDCPRIEAGSPYTLETIPSHPGDGKTQCRGNCGCVLVRLSDGVFGFSRSYD